MLQLREELREMLKVLSIVGTRPEAIKMAPVIHELRRHTDLVDAVLCSTGQHREMLDQALQIFDIEPEIDLRLMTPNQSLSQLTARILTELDTVIGDIRPDWLLVQGDTTTAMAASLAAFYHRVKIGHVEAGLRTDDRSQPFPEEINRRIVDQLATLYFAPTERNRRRLIEEGVAAASIAVTGNTVIDALLYTSRKVHAWPPAVHLPLAPEKRLILVTAHRRENFGQPLVDICRAVAELAARYRNEIQFVFPVHLNPHVRGPVHELLGHTPNVVLTDPVDYETLVYLLANATLVLTDSGGIQEEAPSLDVPVLVLRSVTERAEAVDAGAAKLVGTDCATIVRTAVELLENPLAYARMAAAANPYGDGRAGQRIVDTILEHDSLRRSAQPSELTVAAGD